MILCQRNHLWANNKIGSSNLDIGKFGCAVTCIAMINNKFGASCTPADVAAHVDWYTPQGLILWNKLNLKFAVFLNRECGESIANINAALNDPQKAVMLEVQLPKGTKHWMLASHEDGTSPLYWCDDPWTGTQLLSDHFGPITGAAYFQKRIPALI